MKIKLYRFTIKTRECLPERLGPDVYSYHQTDWSSGSVCLPGLYGTIVKTEEKTIEIEE